MRRAYRIGLCVTIVCALGWLVGADASAQFRKGFSQQLLEVTLTRTKPPRVYLMKTAIAVQVTSQAQRPGVPERLATALESELISNDPRLKPQKTSPETVIVCNIGRLETDQKSESRTVNVSRQVGTERVWNEKKKAYDEKPVYKMVQETQNYLVVTGDISISYQTRDQASGAVLDSDTFNPSYRQEFVNGIGAPSSSDVEQNLIQSTIRQIVPRLAPTKEAIKVQLGRPNDPVDNLNKLGEAGLWTRMLEQLESMPALKESGKDAYRQYNIGVAYEAVGYQAADAASAKKFLEQAAIQYGKALEMKPDEKYFREPQTRIAGAIAAYKTLEDQMASYQKVISEAAAQLQARAEGARSLEAAKQVPAKSDDGALDNSQIIDLVKGGLDEENLLAAIKDAKTVKFDLSAQGLKELLANKVPNRVITAMRTKQTAPARPAPPPARRPAGSAPATPTK